MTILCVTYSQGGGLVFVFHIHICFETMANTPIRSVKFYISCHYLHILFPLITYRTEQEFYQRHNVSQGK